MSSVRQISQIPEDKLALVAVFGPSAKQLYWRHSVRGVPVQWCEITNGKLRLCIFPDGNEQWVNEQNIRSVKISTRVTGEVNVAAAA